MRLINITNGFNRIKNILQIGYVSNILDSVANTI